MIIEKLLQLDVTKRKWAAVLAVLVVSCICYYMITRSSVVKLRTAQAKYADTHTAYASTENHQAEFSNLQKQFEDTKTERLC